MLRMDTSLMLLIIQKVFFRGGRALNAMFYGGNEGSSLGLA